ncbi:hypothetical protein QTO30_02605 [Yoonia sp. GPGPB17]|uniref:hypothetical protein n=1 Tax=Yoonia sp. GPGPB17 TaxID=3026147 RepID=UPI0030BACA43
MPFVGIPSNTVLHDGQQEPETGRIAVVDFGRSSVVVRQEDAEKVKNIEDHREFALELVRRDLYRHYPYGVVSMDVDQVISLEPVVSYDVMPRHAGLLQLKQDGFITLTADGLYRIERQFVRWPAGFEGAFSEDFVLATGVDMPTHGSPRGSGVTREGTGECLYSPLGC